MTRPRPRRSALYMPGSNTRALEKARTLAADTLILDLEDAVSPEMKLQARDQVTEAMAARAFGQREVIIRINGLASPWWLDDLNAAVGAKPDGILVPKVDSVANLAAIAERVGDIGGDQSIRLWAMIETPLAVLDVRAIAASSADIEMRLAGLVLGTNDIAREARMGLVKGRAPMLPLLAQCVLAARAYRIAILDGVFNDIGDAPGFADECAQARQFGFDGKTLIHPNQIEPCNRAFTPDADEVARAREIIAAFELPENRDKGAIRLHGAMVERLHAEIAAYTLALAEAATER